MTRLIFRPKSFNGIFLTGFLLFFATWIFTVVALGSFWVAIPLLLPLMILSILCSLVLINSRQQKIELDEVCVHCRDGQTNNAFRYDEIEQICVSRGEAFDAQAQIYLRLIPRDGSENVVWNLSDYGLPMILRVALALAERSELSSVAVTLHSSREKELRAMTRKLGTLTLLSQPENDEGKSKNWFVTFALESHRQTISLNSCALNSSLSPAPQKRIGLLILALAIGWWLAGAFQIFPLGWVAIAPLWILVYDLPTRQRARLGYFAGFVSFWLINWWLVPTITNGAAAIGASPALGFVLSIVAVTFIAAVHGLQPMICAILARGKSWWTPWLLAAAWTILDYLRDQGPLRHSWGALGFTQTTDALLLRGSPVIGQHGLTFLCAFVGACAALWWMTRKRIFWAMPVGVLIVWHAVGFIPRATLGPTKNVRVLIVQTDVSSLGKNGGLGPFPQALKLTQDATRNQKCDLILWPETTIDLRKAGDGFYGGLDWQIWQSEGPKIPLLTGARSTSTDGSERNEAVLISPDGSAQGYAKTRLVPFGERPPFVEYLPFLAQFAPHPLIERGDGPKTLDLNLGENGSVGINPAICFESCFPLWRDGKKADFNAILTNDEWFGWTEAPRQHRAMAQLRAVETGMPVIQSCNGRYSFYIGADGKILATTKGDAAQTLDVTIPVAK